MDDRDKDVSEIPEQPGDSGGTPAGSDPGFDDWLDGGSDPYAALSEEEDAAAEIADWMAFTSGDAGDPTPAVGEQDEPTEDDEAPVPVEDVVEGTVEETEDVFDGMTEEAEAAEDVVDGTVERVEGAVKDTPLFIVEPLAGSDDPDGEAVSGDERDEDDTAEFFFDRADGGETDLEDLDAWSETEEEPSGEAEIPPPPEVTVPPGDDEGGGERQIGDAERLDSIPIVRDEGRVGDDGGTPVGEEDTGEIPIVGGAAGTSGSVFDYEAAEEDLASGDYLHAATREHQELAASVAAAAGSSAEQVAVSAAIPGLESAVVGFDDVMVPGEVADSAVVRPPTSDLALRIGTGVALVVAFLASLLWRPAIIALALAAFVVAAGEFYSALLHRHYKPLSLFGFLSIIGAGVGTVVWGVIAIPVALALTITVLLLFNAVSNRRRGAVSGFTLTILVAAWIGGFGSFAFPIIESQHYRPLVLTLVAMVAIFDVAGYAVGRRFGRRPLAPKISPKKTVEGFVAGVVATLAAGALASLFVGVIDLPAGLVLGAVVSVFAPLGDLAVSVVKRTLDIKDMGSILPGHGGLLDRIDALIAVIPAVWAALVWMGIL